MCLCPHTHHRSAYTLALVLTVIYVYWDLRMTLATAEPSLWSVLMMQIAHVLATCHAQARRPFAQVLEGSHRGPLCGMLGAISCYWKPTVGCAHGNLCDVTSSLLMQTRRQ